MGSLDKLAFKGFVDTECPRRLFLTLGQNDPRWISPITPIVPRPFEHNEELLDLGHTYETAVYRALRVHGGVKLATSPKGEVVTKTLSPSLLDGYAREVRGGAGRLCLLEHQFEVPDAFARQVFGLTGSQPIPLLEPLSGMRPDLLLLEPHAPCGASELLADGSLRPLEPDDPRVALRVIDIKHTAEMRVGKSHFIEILYYAYALASFLDAHDLRDRIYLPTIGHGILPQHDVNKLFELSVARLDESIVAMHWPDVSHLFASTQRMVRTLYAQAPMPVEKVPVNLQASCGHCRFVEDCKSRLGFRDGVARADWNVRLLPNTTDALCQQLEREGFETVGEVAARIAAYQSSDTPEPLYAEKPLLALKAKALLEGKALAATEVHTGAGRQLSMAIPRMSELELVLDAETDPTNDVVFAVGFVLSCTVSDGLPFHEVNRRWWAHWEGALQRHARASEVDLDAAIAALDPAYVAKAFEGSRRREFERLVRGFAESLWALRGMAGGSLFVGKRDERWGFKYAFGYVNGGTGLDDERMLAEVLVERAYHAVVIASALEILLAVLHPNPKGETEPVGPRFAGFYWSSEQLQHLQDLLERHLGDLIHHPTLRGPLLLLLNWLSPTESEVDPALQHKKIFNLRTFIETSVGLPHILNYTWHGLAHEAWRTPIDRRFWAPHFNYMDFAVWHAFVGERHTGERARRYQTIVEQLLLKIDSVHRLLRRYRGVARETISRSAWEPVPTRDLLRDAPPDTLHPLARVWLLYSKLNGTAQKLEADHHRMTFPAQSIGKLAGGAVSELVVSPKGGFRFELRGLSSNMKVGEGDWCWLLPDRCRDLGGKRLDAHLVELVSLRWSSERSAYQVQANALREDTHPLDTGEAQPGQDHWYLYKNASDTWSDRLFGSSRSLFDRQQMGTSWLGRRLSYLWEIGNDTAIDKPRSFTFGMPEIYLYAPQLLPSLPFEPAAPLLTRTHPAPDPSQQHAIQMALASAICCLQGPPGTGKSQTIAALIDELLHRRGGRPTRILITAASYAALGVVLDKVQASRQADGQPTRAARLQAVFMRSASRDKEPAVQQGRARDLVVGRGKLVLDDQPLVRKGGKRLEDYLEPSFLLLGNAHTLYNLGAPSSSRAQYELLRDDFGFDLIIVDEASQMPADHFLAAACLVKPRVVSLALDPEPAWPAESQEALAPLRCTVPLPPDELTKVVIVGDDRQLPPVQKVKPPRKLKKVLDSLFRFYADGHEVPRYQLRTNYRSMPPIVDYTRKLAIYEGLHAYREEHPYPPLPEPPASVTHPWLRQVLSPSLAVGAIVHDRRFETATSPLEAQMVTRIAVGFFEQMGVSSPEEERTFWREHLGIVSFHNAHGRLVARRILEALTVGVRRTRLQDEELMGCLDATIYSVEKFQGSDRTFILATLGVSSLDQLRAEEAFIYDLNRFNVLTSRAKQKMLLVCSQNLLDYVPRDRETMANAARIRAYAMAFCDREETFQVQDETGRPASLRLRWHETEPLALVEASVPEPPSPAPRLPPTPPTARSVFDLSEVALLDALGGALQSLLEAPSPGVRRDEAIRIACQRLDLSPLDDEALSILGALLDNLLAPSL